MSGNRPNAVPRLANPADLHLGSYPARGNTDRYIHIGSPQNRAVPPGVGNFSDTGNGCSEETFCG